MAAKNPDAFSHSILHQDELRHWHAGRTTLRGGVLSKARNVFALIAVFSAAFLGTLNYPHTALAAEMPAFIAESHTTLRGAVAEAHTLAASIARTIPHFARITPSQSAPSLQHGVPTYTFGEAYTAPSTLQLAAVGDSVASFSTYITSLWHSLTNGNSVTATNTEPSSLYVPPTTRIAASTSTPQVTPAETRNTTSAPSVTYVTNNPVIERIIQAPAPTVSSSSFTTQLQSLKDDILSRIANITTSGANTTSVIYQTIGQASRIDALSGTSLTNVRVNGVSGLTAADIPHDIIASNYLPLIGGALTGDLTISGALSAGSLLVSAISSSGAIQAPYFTATSTSASSTFPNLLSTNSTTTNATSTNLYSAFLVAGSATSTSLFATLGHFTTGVIDTLTATIATITNLTATNATTSALAITGMSPSLLKTDSIGRVVAAIAGTDYLTAANLFAYPFTNNATNTLISFNGGASSTALSANTASFGQTGTTSVSSTGALVTPSLTIAALGGILKGTAGAVSAALSGTDYLAPGSLSAGAGILYNSGTGVITNAIGYLFPGNATNTLIAFNGGLTTTNASTSAISGNTAAFGGSATTSIASNGALTIQTITGLLKATNGLVSQAVAGTDYLTAANLFAYPFGAANNATGTLTQFNGGLTAYSTSTIGNGTQGNGLTVNGGATTTGNQYVAGSFGVGTTSATSRVAIQGSGNGTGNLFTLGNSVFTTVLNVLDNGTAYLLGNLGIGTTTPWRKLSVTDTVSAPQVAIAYDATRYAQLQVNSVGDLIISSSGQDTFWNDDNAWVCTGGSCPAGNPTGTGNIIAENKIAIGTTTPASKLTIETQDAVTNFFQVASSTAQGIFGIFANGHVGIATSSPFRTLSVSGDGVITGNLSIGTLTAGAITVSSITESCPTGYVWVPGEAKYGTLPGFCTMKYDASNDGSNNAVSVAGNLLWVSISQTSAIAQCQAIGPGYHLMNENEWMTIADEIAALPINDIDAAAGLQLATGHGDNAPANSLAAGTSATDPVVSGCNLMKPLSDASNAYVAASCEERGNGASGSTDADKGYYGTGNVWSSSGYSAGASNKSQLRTFVLPNGTVIWDMAGNVWQWTDQTIIFATEAASSTVALNNWAEYNTITNYHALSYARPQQTTWTAASNGIGEMYIGTPSGGISACLRGGTWNDGANDGVFTLNLSAAPSVVNAGVGFRCAR